ncbi:hypothetical protein MY04_5270 [Flammeovirga sp. MY04]|uniref:hypothetical protein n=1 Tax=Flammeovirga sp. MY04 TaxID=1191459 RepID=UPI0008246675|nr:hypothetical protein [Flammeovirga sp. MY04]ANQ52602.2 hypothetical protein MY04_5270 [Flammeovirga sp. MY04]
MIRLPKIVVLMFCMVCAQFTWAQTFSIGDKKKLNKDVIGVNANLTSIQKPQTNKKLIESIKDLNIKSIRYPGGTIGNYWDWDKGWLDSSIPDEVMIKWVVEQNLTKSKQRYTVEDFCELVKTTNTEAIFMLNMLSKDLDHSIRNLKKARDLGVDIKYVELGNEIYFNLPLPMKVYPTPEVLGDTCKIWIDALKKEFPGVKCAVIGTNIERRERHIDWSNRVLSRCPNADAITFHKYSPASLNGAQERVNITAGTEGQTDSKTATRQWPSSEISYADWEKSLLKDDKARTNMWVTTQHNAEGYKKMKLKKDLPIWITEFNMRDDNSIVLGSWAQTLIVSIYYLEFMHANVEVTNIHNVIGALFAQIDAQNDTYSKKQYPLTAGGISTSLFAQATEGMSHKAPLSFDKTPILVNDKDEEFLGLKGYSFFDEEGKERYIMINFTENELVLDAPANLKGKISNSYTTDLANQVVGWESITNSKSKIKKKITLPAFSITLIQ